jgi:hypothetical protein
VPSWLDSGTLTWLVPAIFAIGGFIASEIKNRGKAEATAAAIHRRLNEMRDAVVQLSDTVGEIRDVMLNKGFIEPQRSSPSRPPISRSPMQLK